jgi:superfamily II DNA helicase RecQ
MAIDIKLGMKRKFDYPKSIKEVDELSGEEFERFVFRYLKEYQSYEGQITEKNDYGVDILLWYPENKSNRYGVQCKRYGPKTVLTENDLMKMQKGVDHYGLRDPKTGKPNLILFTSAEEHQVSTRGLAYIENEEIEAYYRDDIIDILKHLDEGLGRNIDQSNYNNIAFDSSKKKNESFKENSKFVDMLKSERKNISKYNKITPVYLVYNDKTIEDIIIKKPITVESLLEVTGIDHKRVELFGLYLVNKIRLFLQLEPLQPKKETLINKEEFEIFLKELRKKIAAYNKIDKLYNVFNNETLLEIVEKIPKNEKELLNIKGIGPVKVELWGKYFIAEINKYL